MDAPILDGDAAPAEESDIALWADRLLLLDSTDDMPASQSLASQYGGTSCPSSPQSLLNIDSDELLFSPKIVTSELDVGYAPCDDNYNLAHACSPAVLCKPEVNTSREDRMGGVGFTAGLESYSRRIVLETQLVKITRPPGVLPTCCFDTADESCFAGDYNFSVGFEPQAKLTKSTPWTYSYSLSKLYVDLRRLCPIRFQTFPSPPPGTVVRCAAVYSESQYRAEAVKLCPNHLTVVDKEGVGGAAGHFIRCNEKSATYETDPETGRFSVCASLPPARATGLSDATGDTSASSADWTTFLYRFMCYSSCPGGIHRRALRLVFTLEAPRGTCGTTGGVVLGRQTVEFKVCACPGRDVYQDENGGKIPALPASVSSPSSADNVSAVTNPSALRSQSMTELAGSRFDASDGGTRNDKKEEVVCEGEIAGSGTYMLHVRTEEHYHILKRVRDALELENHPSLAPDAGQAGAPATKKPKGRLDAKLNIKSATKRTKPVQVEHSEHKAAGSESVCKGGVPGKLKRRMVTAASDLDARCKSHLSSDTAA